ncbi:MAG: hypothetical protein KIS76_17865 [Pyrinomonadaceae bacterium]|nr:hypothetical protein [Pyrinomonadaceae bacterium]
MIPNCIGGYVYGENSLSLAESDLRNTGVGAFAFYAIAERATDSAGAPRTMAWAMHNTSGNSYLAPKMMMKKKKARVVGMALVRHDGVIQHFKFNCRGLGMSANNMTDLAADMVSKGLPINPDLLCDPATAYRTVDFGDDV